MSDLGYRAKYLKGIAEINEGEKVSIALYGNKLCINEIVYIPLNRIKNVENFKVHQVNMSTNLFNKWIGRIYYRFYRNWFFNIIFSLLNQIVNFLSVQKLNILSIEYLDNTGCLCKGLFLAPNNEIKTLTRLINKRRECE